MKALLFLLLLVGCATANPATINPLDKEPDNQITAPSDCVFSTEVDPKGLYYNIRGYMADGIMATSEVSCDDTFVRWMKMKQRPVVIDRA